MKNILCFLFDHKFTTEKEVHFVRVGHCKRCKKKMWGAYMKGLLTGNMFWVYVVGELEDKTDQP